ASVVSHVEHQASAGELDDFALVDFGFRCHSSQLPSFTLVVGIDDVRPEAYTRFRGKLMIARNDQPPLILAMHDLNASPWPRRIPSPLLVLYLGSNFAR